MPTVPQYQRQVGEEALPGASVNPNIDAAATGGGATYDKLYKTSNDLVKTYIKQADDIKVTEAYTKATRAYNDTMYEGKDAILNTTGKHAIGTFFLQPCIFYH